LFKNGRHSQEYRFRHKDGSYRWMRDELVLVEDNDGTPLEVVGYWVDITDRKRAEEAVRESEKALKRTNRALQAVSECNEALVRITNESELLREVCRIIVQSRNHRMAWVGLTENDEAKTVRPAANWGSDDGYLSEIKVSWDDHAKDLGPVARAIVTGKPYVVRDTASDSNFAAWRDAALKRGFLSVIALPLQVNDRPIGCLAIYAPASDAFDDVEVRLLAGLADNLAYGISTIRTRADRARAEDAVREYAEKLERSNRELQDFAYVASHDLQEPLRKIEAFGDRLKTKCSSTLGEDGQLYLDRMQRASARMRALINSLLTYSRITTKAQPFEVLNLTEAAKDAASDLQMRIEKENGRVEIADMPTIDADATQMRQLFLNLIGNGLKFHKAEEAPVVRVSAELCGRDGGPIDGADPQDQWCRIAIADNGIGFDEKYTHRIFSMFQRLHGRNEYEGTGIGLATCRKIVERHGGSITAKTAPGMGATFIVLVPARQAHKE
jgi:signal transduction histidine kinase